ncbi:unnamed protein product [Soboliphyme baturini]|uniref:Uncharacterized protein n=1 Tax=Soboliphyme baturini TaxID=241478 RepID=A0A183IAS0_9BILA|nr:unnamed protein product [Soboliphyme baturini]
MSSNSAPFDRLTHFDCLSRRRPRPRPRPRPRLSLFRILIVRLVRTGRTGEPARNVHLARGGDDHTSISSRLRPHRICLINRVIDLDVLCLTCHASFPLSANDTPRLPVPHATTVVDQSNGRPLL